jgi:8-oxo-dGTP pyrophosphatase MutT (NUDIX family)
MVCLIRTPPPGQWRLPKGLVEEKESLEDTAVREVMEETGLEGAAEGFIDTIEYWFWPQEGGEKKRHHKVVYFYLIKCTGGHTDRHDDEVEEACWLDAQEAVQRLSFASEKKIVEKALAKMRIGERA